jgi:hypothetical protein
MNEFAEAFGDALIHRLEDIKESIDGLYEEPGYRTGITLYDVDKFVLRDYFAARAVSIVSDKYREGHEDGWEGVAKEAYIIADAMLKARAL